MRNFEEKTLRYAYRSDYVRDKRNEKLKSEQSNQHQSILWSQKLCKEKKNDLFLKTKGLAAGPERPLLNECRRFATRGVQPALRMCGAVPPFNINAIMVV